MARRCGARHSGQGRRGSAWIEALPAPRVMQGALEGSNVEPVTQIARLIEVQRAYEMGQSFLETENRRVLDALDTFVR